ncbi:MAG: hypothetical protein KDD60_09605, partial [Bdellovibrionales bacterium]|nr:hypothetical protein [Bdellovibrionales bacterium]
LFADVREVLPELPVLVMSGYSGEGAVQRILNAPHTEYIQKPFTVEDLSLAVRQSLDKCCLDKCCLDKRCSDKARSENSQEGSLKRGE